MYFDHGVTGYFVPLCTANNQSEIITAHVTVGSMEKMPKAACWGMASIFGVTCSLKMCLKTPNSPTKFQITTKKMLGFPSKSRLRRVYFQGASC